MLLIDETSIYSSGNYDIRHVGDHYAAYDKSGRFIISGDTIKEIEDDLKEMEDK